MTTYVFIYLCRVILVTNTIRYFRQTPVCLGCGVYAAWRRWFWQTGLGERRPPRSFHRTQRGQLPLPESGQRGLQPDTQGTHTSISYRWDIQAPGEWVVSESLNLVAKWNLDGLYFGLWICLFVCVGCWSKHCASKRAWPGCSGTTEESPALQPWKHPSPLQVYDHIHQSAQFIHTFLDPSTINESIHAFI